MKCSECGAETFLCPVCGSKVPLSDMVDIFHIGVCSTCKASADEPCPERVCDSTVWSAVKLICKRLPWFYINTATVVLTVVAALIYSWATCEGTVVRGLFWLECLG